MTQEFGVSEEGAEGVLVPMLFVASTETAYVVPFARPPMAHDVPLVEQVRPPGLAVAR